MFCHWTIHNSKIIFIASFLRHEIKDTTDTLMSASYFSSLKLMKEENYICIDISIDFSFHIVNFPFTFGNISAPPAYGFMAYTFCLACSHGRRDIMIGFPAAVVASTICKSFWQHQYIKNYLSKKIKKNYLSYMYVNNIWYAIEQGQVHLSYSAI